MKYTYYAIATSIVLGMLSTLNTTTCTAETSTTYVTTNTLLQTKRYILGEEATPYDANHDGYINVLDLVTIKQILLKGSTQSSSTLRTVKVSTSEELMDALTNAMAGDEIVLTSELYARDSSSPNPKGAIFYSNAEGTKEHPITIRSENPDSMATLSGYSTSTGAVLYITGDYWNVQDLKVTNSQKGILLDHSNYSNVTGCEVYGIGSEGIHLRDSSSYCTVSSCNVHDTGVVSPPYGEAIYIGTYHEDTGYGFDCNYNTISKCTLGPNVSAEHVDIKEQTVGTIVEYCTFYGEGMSGENYADSFVDAQGNDSIIRYNTGYRLQNPNVTSAFQYHVLIDGWGQNNQFYGNSLYLDDSSIYILDGWDATNYCYDNTLMNSTGNVCHGDYIDHSPEE